MAKTKKTLTFDENKLNKQDLEHFTFVKERLTQLRDARKEMHPELENIWLSAERDYIPHRLKTKGKKVVATDEEKGWRGSMVELGKTGNWQSDISQPNVFVKLQTALSILIDQNPTGVFSAASKKFQKTTELVRQLYQRSWEVGRSKQQLKLFVHNLSKYGWAIARTYPMKLTRTTRVIKSYDPDDPLKTEYEEKEAVEFNGIMRENLNVWNAWIDNMARPNNEFSVRDWAWRKVYSWDVAEEEFSKYENWKYVVPGGITSDRLDVAQPNSQPKEQNLVEVYFYENRIKDLFMVIVNDIPVVIEPLPVSDANGVKKLSCWQTYWNLRDANSLYGIGIYESIRYDQAVKDRLRNMTIDQLTLSIYKMWFFQGTQSLTETGDIVIEPGKGKQVLDPKNINWLEVPGPGREAWEGLAMLQKDIDEASGITDPLIGEITGKTAFETAQAKESALKRLKTPLDNIKDALEQDGYITLSLNQMIYSVPEIYQIADPGLIEDYLTEIKSDQELYRRNDSGAFEAVVYPEMALNLDENEEGALVESPESRFFRIKPKHLNWDGIITIKAQSILTPSKQVEKAMDLEMFNILIPLLQNPPELYSKIAKTIVKLYDKDPKDILPDAWLVDTTPKEQLMEESLIVDQSQVAQAQMQEQAPMNQLNQSQMGTQTPSAQRMTSRVQIPARPQSMVGKIASKLTAPFR